VRGIGVRPDGESAAIFAAFNTAFTSRYGSNPRTSGMGSSYDAMYAIAYAIASTPGTPVTGAMVARGLASLGAGDPVSVGQGQASLALQTLAAGKSIALRGTFSSMLWDSHGDIVGGTAEVWCVGTAGGATAFGSSGLTMDVATQFISGAYVQCP
jgi:ABC-type branched-subunit amino acid transport system substrate-binding protein